MMRRQLQTISLCALLLLLVAGCGENSNKSVFGTNKDGEIISMFEGETTQVQEGDKLVPDNAKTRVKVEHILDDNTKYITILSGSATLLRGSYALK